MLKPVSLTDVDIAALCNRAQSVPSEVAESAAAIVADVAKNGDAALRLWTKKLDGCDLQDSFLDHAAWAELASQCPPEVQSAINANMSRIEAFHARQVGQDDAFDVAPGVRLGRRAVPHQVAGCYVPGGRASYPSSVLMTVIPARLAGVERIIVATPPQTDGTIDPAVAFAAQAAGATDILLAGGAQAIAALAHGTTSVPRADCIVGPGNAYVTAAKQLVSGLVWTDAPAGPSELLVIADSTANPRYIAADMVAQAEHDPDAQCILVTDSVELADGVAAELTKQAPAAARAEIVQQSLQNFGKLLLVESMDEAINFTNDYAPEHLEIQTTDPQAIAAMVRNAGSIFLGSHAPVPLGDYGSGTNHVLPTMGYARIRGGLSVEDFRKWVTWQEVTESGLSAVGNDIIALATAEGFHGHAEAVRIRLEDSK